MFASLFKKASVYGAAAPPRALEGSLANGSRPEVVSSDGVPPVRLAKVSASMPLVPFKSRLLKRWSACCRLMATPVMRAPTKKASFVMIPLPCTSSDRKTSLAANPFLACIEASPLAYACLSLASCDGSGGPLAAGTGRGAARAGGGMPLPDGLRDRIAIGCEPANGSGSGPVVVGDTGCEPPGGPPLDRRIGGRPGPPTPRGGMPIGRPVGPSGAPPGAPG